FGEQQAKEEPERAIKAGELERIERRADFGRSRMGDVGRDLPQLQALRAELFKAGQSRRRKKLHNLAERLLRRLALLLPLGRGRLGIDVFLKLGVRAEQAQIGKFRREHQWPEKNRIERKQRKARSAGQ